MDLATLNPKSRAMTIGIKKSYEITLYPLSFGDEMEFTEVFSTIIMDYSALDDEDKNDMALLSIVMESLQKNLPRLVPLIIDLEEWEKQEPDKSVLKCMDNEQMAELVTHVFEMNFGSNVEKKVRTLMTKIGTIFQRQIPPLPSVN